MKRTPQMLMAIALSIVLFNCKKEANPEDKKETLSGPGTLILKTTSTCSEIDTSCLINHHIGISNRLDSNITRGISPGYRGNILTMFFFTKGKDSIEWATYYDPIKYHKAGIYTRIDTIKNLKSGTYWCVNGIAEALSCYNDSIMNNGGDDGHAFPFHQWSVNIDAGTTIYSTNNLKRW